MNVRRLPLTIALVSVVACSRNSRQVQPASEVAAAPPSYEAELGRDVYVHYCTTCHGDSGAGDGFNAYNLDPHPRDLSDPAYQKKKSDAELADAIRRGGAGVGLSSLMPPWGRTLTERQVGEVVFYLRSLKKTAH